MTLWPLCVEPWLYISCRDGSRASMTCSAVSSLSSAVCKCCVRYYTEICTMSVVMNASAKLLFVLALFLFFFSNYLVVQLLLHNGISSQ